MIETLQKKIEQLQKERENAQIALFNYNGAIAVLQQLLVEEHGQANVAPTPFAKTPKVITLPKPEHDPSNTSSS